MSPYELELYSLTIDETLSPAYEAAPATESDLACADDRLDAWRRICADGDEAVFLARLARDGLDYADVRARLARVARRADVPPPAWIDGALCLLAELKEGKLHHDAAACNDQPFESLLMPLVAGGLVELECAVGSSFARWASFTAQQDMARQLWQRSVELCGLAIYRSFVIWRHAAPDSAGTEHLANIERYDAFVSYMRSEGLDAMFRAQPMLLRLLALVRQQWVEAYAEMLLRLNADWRDMKQLDAALQGDELCLGGVNYGLSDPHDNGRSVIILRMQGGCRLVYKPKSLVGEEIVADVDSLLRENGFTLPLYLPRYIKREGYGWVQFIESLSCETMSEVEDYYRCAGAWLGLTWLLSTTDLHMENVIACGAHPIPLDFETVLQGLALHQPAAVKPEEAGLWAANAFLERSVLAVGLLPGYTRSDDRSVLSVGGLEASTSRTRRIVWKNAGTMQLAPVVVEDVSTIDSNLPLHNGRHIPATARPAPLKEGFEMLLDFVMRHRKLLLTLLHKVMRRPIAVRRVMRPTRFYYLLLRRLLDHRNMRDSVRWSMEVEFIARLYNWDEDSEEPWKLFARERQALLNLDIPIFHLHADRTVVQVGAEDVTNLHIQSGLEVVTSRVSGLDAQAIQTQSDLVAMTLQNNEVKRRAAVRPIGNTMNESLLRTTAALPGRELADEVFAHIKARAFVGGRSACWLGIETFDHEAVNQIVPLGYDLYNGSAGIALFLAAYATVSQSAPAADLARRALAAPIAAIHSHNRNRLARSMGIGAGVGLASLVYVLAQTAQLLKAPDAMAAAVSAAELFTDSAIAQDDRFDLMGGAAGACLVLLKLYRMTKSQVALDGALRCVAHLELNQPVDGSPWSSVLFRGEALTGISHGAAGYALALSRMYAATGVERYRDLVKKCLDFETKTFDISCNEWPDLRAHLHKGDAKAPVQWCHGATGIGYARLAMLCDGAVSQRVLLDDVRLAVNATLRAVLSNNDTLCCGIAGRADFLLEAGRVLKDPSLSMHAQIMLGNLTQGWSDTGDARWDTGTGEFNLGLFRGAAGIGYSALRLRAPSLPRVLVWD